MASTAAGETPASDDAEVAIIRFAMAFSLRIATVGAGLAVTIGAGLVTPAPAFPIDREEDLLPRIQNEHNPVKRAKYEIRLGHLKLVQGTEACEKDDHETCSKLVAAYLDLMNNSWKDLEASGKQAVKQPSGFKELDIALREDDRILGDAQHKMPLEDREALEKVIKQIEKLHEDVLAALFPSQGRSPGNIKPVPKGASH
jgi:hypothetical protein